MLITAAFLRVDPLEGDVKKCCRNSPNFTVVVVKQVTLHGNLTFVLCAFHLPFFVFPFYASCPIMFPFSVDYHFSVCSFNLLGRKGGAGTQDQIPSQ